MVTSGVNELKDNLPINQISRTPKEAHLVLVCRQNKHSLCRGRAQTGELLRGLAHDVGA